LLDQPGTTRDSIYIDFQHKDKSYTLIDTAGLRRRGQVNETIEKFSVIKTLQAIEDANVVVLVLDAHSEISDQDAHIAQFILEAGCALVIAVNKWDDLDEYQRDTIKRELSRKLQFLSFAQLHYISALHGTGINNLLPSIDQAYAAAMAKLSTPKLTRTLIAAVERHSPPRGGMSRPKMRYAHQGDPITFDCCAWQYAGTCARKLSALFRECFRETFKLIGTPLRVDFKVGHNPYSDKKPAPLTESELRTRITKDGEIGKNTGKTQIYWNKCMCKRLS
jgi:GTP-binding protein